MWLPARNCLEFLWEFITVMHHGVGVLLAELFPFFDLGIWRRRWVHCVRNSLYGFITINLKLCMLCFRGLQICKWFLINRQLNFCHFFRLLNRDFWDLNTSKVHNRGYLVCATPPTVDQHEILQALLSWTVNALALSQISFLSLYLRNKLFRTVLKCPR